MIEYRKGDATQPVGAGPKIIAHICNDLGAWGKGFVLALSKRWKEPEKQYRWWAKGQTTLFDPPTPSFKLGEVLFVEVESDIIVANMVAQHGIGWKDGKPPIRYNALGKALNAVALEALTNNASVHMPRIGCGLAGGKWTAIEEIINEELIYQDISVTVYNL